jgi:hypothetical protein
LGATVFIGGVVQVFGRTEQPVEGNDDEVDNVGVESAVLGVLSVEGVHEAADDGDVRWMSPGGWIVFVPESLEESSEYRIVSEGSVSFFSGIPATQVGDALAHRRKGLRDRITSIRLFGGAGAMPIAEPEDEEVAELVRPTRDISEGSGVMVFLTEGGPDPEEGVCGFA